MIFCRSIRRSDTGFDSVFKCAFWEPSHKNDLSKYKTPVGRFSDMTTFTPRFQGGSKFVFMIQEKNNLFNNTKVLEIVQK